VKRDRKRHEKLEKSAPKGYDWQRLTTRAPVLAVLLVALAAYAGSFRAPVLPELNDAVLQDNRIQANTSENVSRIFSEPYLHADIARDYRPLTTWSFLFNYAILGKGSDPASYHWLNFLLHALNIVLVYALALALFRDRLAGLAAAALWGLHPALTDAVVNPAGRADLLAAAGALASLLCYRAATLSTGMRRVLAIAGVALAAGLAVWSKETGVVAVALLAASALLFGVNGPALAAAALPAAAFFAVRSGILARFPAGPVPFVANPLSGATFDAAHMTSFKLIAKYLGTLIWPARLSADYSYGAIPVAVDAGGIAGVILFLGAIALAVWASRRRPALSFAIAFLLIALAPASNLFGLTPEIMNERWLYLPAVGFVLAIVCGLQILPAPRRTVALVVVVVLLAFTVRTLLRARDWADAPRLWQSVIDAAPQSYRGHIRYAATLPLDRKADRDRAVAEIGRTLAILDPLPPVNNAPEAYRTAGAIYRQMGDEVALHRADPDGTQPNEWYQRALVTLDRSEGMEEARDQALVAYNARRGVARQTFAPSSIYFEIGRTYLRMAQQLQALSFYEKGRALEPNADLLEDEAATLESYSDYRKAAQTYIEALEVDGSRNDLTGKIVEMYSKAEPNGCAVANGQLNVQCPMVHQDICGAAAKVEATLSNRGRTEDAVAVRRVAIIDLGCTGVNGK
jgi:protein O-mannosyl-transferase